MIAGRAPVTISVSRNEVETLDTSSVVGILDSFAPVLFDHNRNRVQIEILGYLEDSRELYDIPEIRVFFAKLFDDTDSLFYWMDIQSYMLMFLGLMLYPPVRSGGQVTLNPFHLQAYLQRVFVKLNKFCLRWEQSPDPTTHLVRQALRVEG